MSLLIGVAALCTWLYLLLLRGFFWRVQITVAPPVPAARIVAVVPARDEGHTVARAVRSLLTQSDIDLSVILVDDASTDDTVLQARAAADWCSSPERLTILSGAPLPPGWTGKLWAVQQGIERALALHPDFLLLTDADIEHGPGALATLVRIAAYYRVDLASYMVKLHCKSFAERLLIPAFVYFFFKLYPPHWIADPHANTAGAAGGCMLIRPEALQSAGGIAAVRSQIIDDCALAKVIKRSGGRVWLGLPEASRSVRHYGTVFDVGSMISRTAFSQLHHSTLLLLATIAGLLLTYVAPVALLASTHRAPMLLGGLSWVLMTASYVPMVRYYGRNPLWALTLPVSAVFYMGATVWSAVLYWTGRGGQWKGRAQDVAGAAAP